MVKLTGVRVSAEQLEEARRRSRQAREAPVARVLGRWLHEDAAEAFKKWIDDLAVSCGLPAPGLVDGEINHYGMTPDGEFNMYVPDQEAQ